MLDLSELAELSNENVSKVLNENFRDGSPYISCGEVCISVNPYRWLDLYNDEIAEIYRTEPDQLPHLFKVAQSALNALHQTDQIILISGESGSGKSEGTKIIFKYISKTSFGCDKSLFASICTSAPILEYFGNAYTTRNSNSSRFGKFITLYANESGKTFQSASIDTYLLP